VIRYLGIFNSERVLVTNPKALAEVLVTKNYDFIKPEQVRSAISRLLGVGVLLAEGDEHRMQRKNLMPAFAFRHVKDLYPVFWGKSREAVEAMTEFARANAGKEDKQLLAQQDPEKARKPLDDKTAVFEVGEWASRATLDIIGTAGLGRDFGAIKDPNNELVRVYTALFKPNRQAQLLGLVSIFLPAWFVHLLPVKRNHDIHSASKYIRSVCADLIRSKKAAMHVADKKEEPTTDILSVALESGVFTDENLVDQLMTFLAAGHETTASAMTWAAYMMCVHPDVQTRLREEVRSRLPSPDDDNATVSSIDIDHMPYLNAVCNEVLRYWGPVPQTLREAARDTTIQGHLVPKGTRIMLPVWGANRSIAMWGGDAMHFNPERWLPKADGGADAAKQAGSGGAISNYSFMTFLHGPRSCIGSGFARAEFACLLAAWVGRFEFDLANEEERDEKKVDIKGGITARPAKGLTLRVKVVEGW